MSFFTICPSLLKYGVKTKKFSPVGHVIKWKVEMEGDKIFDQGRVEALTVVESCFESRHVIIT